MRIEVTAGIAFLILVLNSGCGGSEDDNGGDKKNEGNAKKEEGTGNVHDNLLNAKKEMNASLALIKTEEDVKKHADACKKAAKAEGEKWKAMMLLPDTAEEMGEAQMKAIKAESEIYSKHYFRIRKFKGGEELFKAIGNLTMPMDELGD